MSSHPDASRADPFADNSLSVADFKPKVAKAPPPEKVREVSEAQQFKSREAKAEPVAAPSPTQQRRRRTGRNVQLNVKVTQDVMERFTRISDKNGWVFGETMEKALNALESLDRASGVIK